MKLLTISSPVSKSLEFQDKMVSGCWDDPDRGGHDSREVHYGQLQGQDDLGALDLFLLVLCVAYEMAVFFYM